MWSRFKAPYVDGTVESDSLWNPCSDTKVPDMNCQESGDVGDIRTYNCHMITAHPIHSHLYSMQQSANTNLPNFQLLPSLYFVWLVPQSSYDIKMVDTPMYVCIVIANLYTNCADLTALNLYYWNFERNFFDTKLNPVNTLRHFFNITSSIFKHSL